MFNWGRLCRYNEAQDNPEIRGRLGGHYGLYGCIKANPVLAARFEVDKPDEADDDDDHPAVEDYQVQVKNADGMVVAAFETDTFSGNCGNMLVWSMAIYNHTPVAEIFEAVELLARESFHGMVLYGVTPSRQDALVVAMESRGWVKLYQFKSPRTDNVCAMYGKDLTV